MNELKAKHVVDVYDEYSANPTNEAQVYLKSEADKVIAELNARIADGDKDFDWAEHQNEMLLQIVRHHKYKRCLAMYKVCLYELDVAFKDPCIERSAKNCVFWRKWTNRWRDIAEYLKEEK